MSRSIAFALCLALASAAGCAAHPPVPVTVAPSDAGIVVSAEGEAKAKPDIAVLRLGIEALRPTMEEARAAGATAQARIFESLKKHGVAQADMQTEHLSFSPQYDYMREGRVLRGYAATNMLRVTVRDLTKIPSIVDAAIEAGDNDARMHGISFELSDPEAARAEARSDAVAKAKKKAEQLARELGVSLDEPLAVEEVGYGAPSPILMRAPLEEAAAGPTPIAEGAIETRITVRVRWAIDAG